MSKKVKGIIISMLLSIAPYVILIVLIFGGVTAAVSVFSGTEETVGENASCEDLLAAVSDKDIMTDELMNGWMLDRRSMKRLLKEITEYNNRKAKEKTFAVEVEEQWTQIIPPPTPIPKKEGEEEEPPVILTPTYIPRVEYYYVDILISENQSIIQRYPVDWQLAYLLCVYDVIDIGFDGTDDETGEKITISKAKVKELIEAIKPKFEYVFNPIEYWGGWYPHLSLGEVAAHPHNTYSYSIPGGVNETQHHIYYHTPKMVLGKVITPWKVDTYILNEDDSYTVETKYDATVFLEVFEKYGGKREVELFLEAMDLLPGGVRIGDEIRKALKESGYEI